MEAMSRVSLRAASSHQRSGNGASLPPSLFGSAQQPPAGATPLDEGFPRPGAVRAVLFDALGTLVALDPPAPALKRGLAHYAGIDISLAQAERAIATEIAYYRAHLDEGRDERSLADLRRRCAAALSAALPETAAGAPLELVEEALLSSLHFRAFDDARAALVAARAAAGKVVVVSNWDVSLEHVLAQLGFAPLLDGIITSARVGARKPSSQIFIEALALAGVQPDHAVHVGDNVDEDVAGAVSAGIAPVLVRRDGRPGPPGVATVSALGEIPFERWSTP